MPRHKMPDIIVLLPGVTGFGDEGVERAADAFAIADLGSGDWSDRL